MSTTATPRPAATAGPPHGAIDPRGPQLAAGLTAVVLVAVLLLPAPYSVALLAVQAALFALGAVRGVQATPHAWAFRTLVRPRLGPPREWEAPEPPRFAQAVGLGFAVVGLVALLAGATVVGQVAVGAALVAALLNAVFALCLGCEVYLLLRRATARRIAA
ncbi:DUF4395 domain-containing protein [Nocardioides sp. zg-1308]|uniref:DUF4395 domain-containing protein n=1 Tax=Nocardioides renjunii TaxID=3095075 RepID=A0ABU5K794_9ACTN|nr:MULTISPECIES: DUF4395 domain-containing protein [unclassified Nocardioides]MDZ5660837.1 DUF4395 domain-containing protein [Nocardioides sp. S-58]NPD03960.1 DUF4395 domain-containing protein [Nocardioides sp. zg-1308]